MRIPKISFRSTFSKLKSRIIFLSRTVPMFFLLLAILGVFFLLYIPSSRTLARLRKEYKNINAEAALAQENIRQIPNPEKDIQALKARLEEAEHKFIHRDQLPRVIEQLFQKTSELGIEVISINPKEEPQINAQEKIFIEVKMRCNFFGLGNYLESLENLPILFTVENLTIRKDESSGVEKLLVDMLLACYLADHQG